MRTELAAEFAGTPDGQEADAILRKCVHCGFCTATCPTYQLLGDELDGPRGRIYLIKQVLEGAPVTRATQLHLDRCLTCRNCETTCPSGVQYGNLVDIGRRIVEERVERPRDERAKRWLLREGLTSPLLGPAVALGRTFRRVVPPALREKLPAHAPDAHARQWPTREHPRRMLLLAGCVQPALMPNVNSATARVLDAAGIQTVVADEAGCCGAMDEHLGDHVGALARIRRNIDAWWPLVDGRTSQNQAEAIVMNASGCGVTVKEYAHAMANDPAYADKARRISELTKDLSEIVPALVPELKRRLPRARTARPPVVYHAPCTLQHGQKLRGGVETALAELGIEVRLAAAEAHLCCGSAGAYSLLQPEISHALRDRKLANLLPDGADAPGAARCIVSANIGCIAHLQSGTSVPVRHWIELVDDVLAAA